MTDKQYGVMDEGNRAHFGGSSILVEMSGSNLYLRDLEGDGDPKDMALLVAWVDELASKNHVFFPIGEGEVYDSIRAVLTRLGGSKYIELWHINRSENHGQ